MSADHEIFCKQPLIVAVDHEIKVKNCKNDRNTPKIGHSHPLMVDVDTNFCCLQPLMMAVDTIFCCLQPLMMAVDKNLIQDLSLLTFKQGFGLDLSSMKNWMQKKMQLCRFRFW